MSPAPFQDQVAIITGAASGIGAATAHLLAARGAHVVLVDRNQEGLKRTAVMAEEAGGTARIAQADVTSADDAQRIAAEIAGEFGRIDVLAVEGGEHVVRRQAARPHQRVARRGVFCGRAERQAGRR